MARPRDFNDFEVKDFAGLDLRGPPELIKDRSLQSCINFDIGPVGELRKRPGWRDPTGSPAMPSNRSVKIIGSLINKDYSQLIALAENTTPGSTGLIYFSSDNGITWTQIPGSGVGRYGCGAQYNGIFHIPTDDTVANGGVKYWTGTGAFTNLPNTPQSLNRGVILQDRLFLIDMTSRNVVYSNPVAWNGPWPSGNSIGYSSDDKDLIVGIIGYRDKLVMLRTNSINVLYLNGPPTSWQLKTFLFNVGCQNENCALIYDDLLYLLSPSGVFRTDLSTTEEISKPIFPLFLQRRQLLTQSSKWVDCIGYWNRRIICSMKTAFTGPSSFRMMVYNTVNNSWTEWIPAIPDPDFGLTGFAYPPIRDMFPVFYGKRPTTSQWVKEGLYTTTFASNGRVYHLDDETPIYVDNAAYPYVSSVKTKNIDVDLPSEWKRSHTVTVRASRPATNTLSARYTVNEVQKPSVTLNPTASPTQMKMKGPGWFRNFNIELSDNGTDYTQIDAITTSIKRKSELSETAT